MNEETHLDENGMWLPSYGGAVSLAFLTATLPVPDAVVASPLEPESRYVVPHSMSSTLSGLVEFEQVEEIEPYRPQTALGRKLLELRQEAVAGGMELWNADRISEEIQDRRGEV